MSRISDQQQKQFLDSTAYCAIIMNDDRGVLANYAYGIGSRVTSRLSMDELGSVTPQVGLIVQIDDLRKEGPFICRTGTPPVTDTYNGVYKLSDTPGYYWERIRDPRIALPEWFGAVIDDGDVDSYHALQACLDVTGHMNLSKGNYYSSRGLVLPDGACVRGLGSLLSGIIISHATDHLMSQAGVAGVSYAGGADLEGFAVARSVAPLTPANVADDANQAHGLRFFMVSNPRVRNVYMYDNLVDVYISNCLSADIHGVRGIRQTGGASDRAYGLWIDGLTTGGTFGGPSPNPSTTITKPNMVANASVGQTYNYYLSGALQDLWIVDPEAAGGQKQFFLNIDGENAGDVHIVRPIADGFKGVGVHIYGAPIGSSIDIEGAWVAPASSAAGPGIWIDASHGVNLKARGDFSASSGARAVSANDCTELDCDIRVLNSQYPAYATSVKNSRIIAKAHKDFAGAGGSFGSIATIIGGRNNSIFVYGTISLDASKQLWDSGIAFDSTASNCYANAAGVYSSDVTNAVTISGVGVSTQGNVSGHVFIIPGNGALL